MLPTQILHLRVVAIVEPDFIGVCFRSQNGKSFAAPTNGVELPLVIR